MSTELILPKLFTEGCVLQRGENCRVWGWCEPKTSVTGEIAGKSASAVSDMDGYFELLFHWLLEGGPYSMRLQTSGGDELGIKEVYVGDVFVCGGQSNMELTMNRVRVKYPGEYESGAPDVHIYKVTEKYDFHGPLPDHEQAAWTVCTAENINNVSAFSYFFGKQMQERKKVPVGILNLSLGGTPVEAWTSQEGLNGFPYLLELQKPYQRDAFCKDLMVRKQREEEEWQEEIRRQECSEKHGEYKSGVLQLPGFFSEQGLKNFCGSILLRKEFELSEEWKEGALLRLGTLTDSDQTYVNGVLVGSTGYCYPPRRYPVPGDVLKIGKNTVEIHLICRDGQGRMTPGKFIDLINAGQKEELADRVSLEGDWNYEMLSATAPAPEQEFLNRKPAGLFNGMTAPCTGYVVKGVIWYQGESNDGHPDDYEELLKNFIRDWRRHWQQERLPFVICQLPNCDIDIAPEDAWAKIRDAQRKAADLPDTAVTVNLDLGENNDLHPLNKKDTAARAVLAACGLMDHDAVIWKGPEIRKIVRNGKELILKMKVWDDEGLFTHDGKEPGEFELAGSDGIFHPVRARIHKNEIHLDIEHTEAKHVRYAWRNAPDCGLICSSAGLLMSPGVWEIQDQQEVMR